MRSRALLAVIVGLAACSSTTRDVPLPGGVAARDLPIRVDSSIDDPVHVLVTATASLRDLWRDDGPSQLKGRPVLEGGVVGVQSDDDPPKCGGRRIATAEVAQNALYCPSEDVVIVDLEGLGEPTLAEHGPLALALIVAHEAGHALQQHATIRLDPLVAELQADCFAGVFAARVRDGHDPNWSATQGELASPVQALLDLSDSPGTQSTDPSAHGTGLDRASALLDGMRGGSMRCWEYQSSPPAVTSQGFVDSDEAITRGQMPLSDLLVLAGRDLEQHNDVLGDGLGLFWAPTRAIAFEAPSGCDPDPMSIVWFCPDGPAVVKQARMEQLASLGNFAALAEIERGWAIEAQRRWPTHLRAGDDATECLVGYWLGTRHPRADHRADQTLYLSPGDLDDVVRALLREPASTDPLRRLAALLTGFRDGRLACEFPASQDPANTTEAPRP